MAKEKAEAERLAKEKAEAERLANTKAETELRKDGLYVSFQDLTKLSDDDLQVLGKMAGLNMLDRRQLINAVQELRKV